jgi:hypothetical protein
VLKPSGFLFRTPRQQGAFTRALARFAKETSCGLEALALRRDYGGRAEGSIIDIAERAFRLIREGKVNFSNALNLARAIGELAPQLLDHHANYLARKAEAEEELHRAIDAKKMDDAAALTGMFVTQADIFRLTQGGG